MIFFVKRLFTYVIKTVHIHTLKIVPEYSFVHGTRWQYMVVSIEDELASQISLILTYRAVVFRLIQHILEAF